MVSGNGIRVGIDVSWSGVSNSSSSATATINYYVGDYYWFNDNETINFGGGLISGSATFFNNFGSSGGPDGKAHLVATRTYTYSYGSSEYGSSPGTASFSASVTGSSNGSSPYKIVTSNIPARPYAAPAAPSGVTLGWQGDGSGSSDTVVTSWTRHSTAAAPYSSLQVQFARYDGTQLSAYGVTGTFTTTGGASSYAMSRGTANRVWQARVRAVNAAGVSAWVAVASGSYLFGVPSAPSSVAARISTSGSSIVLSWVPNSYTVGSTTIEVYRSVNGGAYASVIAGLSPSSTGWVDSSPGAGSNTYQVRAHHAAGTFDKADLYSPWATSNTVSTIVAPLSPGNLRINGAGGGLSNSPVDLTQNNTITWTHNDGGDGAAMSAFSIQYSADGGSTWTQLVTNQASTVSSYTLPANTLTNGSTYQFEVQDEGIASAGFGPWSSVLTITGVSTPVVTITSPVAAPSTGHLTVSWSYSQAQSSPQTQFSIAVADSMGNDVDYIDGTTATSVALPFHYGNGASYTLSLLVVCSLGAATTKTLTFTPAYAIPAVTIADVSYQPLTGTALISMDAGTPATGESVAVGASVERSLDGGNTWVMLAPSLTLPVDFIDPLPNVAGDNTYRITSISAEPAYRANDLITLTAPQGTLDGSGQAYGNPSLAWIFVSWGDSFSNLVATRSNTATSETRSGSRAVVPMMGVKYPAVQFGANRSRVVSVTAQSVYSVPGMSGDPDYVWDSPPQDWLDMADEATVVCYRDYTGRRIFGMLGDMQSADVQMGCSNLTFTVTEVNFTEQWGANSIGGVS
jgi:hypothetical protein